MAVFTGDDILEIRCQHSTGDYTFEAKSNESFNIDLGGIRISDDANGITGSGSPIYQKNRLFQHLFSMTDYEVKGVRIEMKNFHWSQ